jgi:hypothetical protein
LLTSGVAQGATGDTPWRSKRSPRDNPVLFEVKMSLSSKNPQIRMKAWAGQTMVALSENVMSRH